MAPSATDNSAHEFQDGLTHLARKRWPAAVASLRIAFRREPARLAVVRALATACIQAGDVAQARRALADFTMNSPMSAEGWRLAAQFEWKLNRYDDAIEILATGLERLPNSQLLHKQTALFWGARGRLESSAQHANRVTDGGAVQKFLAAAQQVTEPVAAGETMFTASATIAESPAADYFDRVAQDPKLLDGLLNLPADTDADLDMLKGIEARLAALLESQPHHADRQLVLARLRVKIDALPAAMLSVQRALRANPGYVDAHRLRATILGKMGEFGEAIGVLEGLIARGMDWPDLHVQIAEFERERGRADEARSHLYSAIRLNPGFERAKQMLERCAA
jgi:tetratricopeptide (TPR) repeat protein